MPKSKRLKSGREVFPIQVAREGDTVGIVLHLGWDYRLLMPMVKSPDGQYRRVRKSDTITHSFANDGEDVAMSVLVRFSLQNPRASLVVEPVFLRPDDKPLRVETVLPGHRLLTETVPSHVVSTLLPLLPRRGRGIHKAGFLYRLSKALEA